jgi:Ser/Thr protein kinase RdoA (MazF antagonist)
MPAEGESRLRDVLAHAFGVNGVSAVVRCGGLSADNYRVVTSQQVFLLKELALADCAEALGHTLGRLALRTPLVRAPISSTEGARAVRHGGRTYLLLPFVEGRVLRGSQLGARSLHSAGRSLRELHDALASLSRPLDSPRTRERPSAVDEATLARSAPLPAASTLLGSLRTKREALALTGDHASGCAAAIIHGDFHNENLVFDENDTVTAVLDCEDVCQVPLTVDIIDFIHLACCEGEYDTAGLRRALHFLEGYGERLTSEILTDGFTCWIARRAGSWFLESAYLRAPSYLLLRMIERDRLALEFLLAHREGVAAALADRS